MSEVKKLTREEIIDMISNCINKDRQNTYGKPEDNFHVIASLWNTYWGSKTGLSYNMYNAKDVAIMMMLLKIARMVSSPDHLDNYVDAAGYSIIAGSMCTISDNKK